MCPVTACRPFAVAALALVPLLAGTAAAQESPHPLPALTADFWAAYAVPNDQGGHNCVARTHGYGYSVLINWDREIRTK